MYAINIGVDKDSIVGLFQLVTNDFIKEYPNDDYVLVDVIRKDSNGNETRTRKGLRPIPILVDADTKNEAVEKVEKFLKEIDYDDASLGNYFEPEVNQDSMDCLERFYLEEADHEIVSKWVSYFRRI